MSAGVPFRARDAYAATLATSQETHMRKLMSALPIVAALVAGFLFGYSGDARAAADSCTDWMKQANGCSERVCVDSKGTQYCQQKCGSTITRISCF
jgi:hypothetical protein